MHGENDVQRIKRVYVDSTVIYGAPEKKYAEGSRLFWQAVRNGKIVIIASDVLDEELERATQYVRDIFKRLPNSSVERVTSTPESNALAAQYLAENVVGNSNITDCRHVALATVLHADAIVAWNFQHIIERGEGYKDVNEKLGYPRIAILTPEQFMEVHHDCT
jgi:predicted nucleic acid-binding protein